MILGIPTCAKLSESRLLNVLCIVKFNTDILFQMHLHPEKERFVIMKVPKDHDHEDTGESMSLSPLCYWLLSNISLFLTTHAREIIFSNIKST